MIRKKFDKNLWKENDDKAKQALLKLFEDKKGIKIEENPNSKGVDLLLYRYGHYVANIEVEIKKDKKWNEDFPYEDVQLPFRKKKFAELEKPTYFIIFNHDQTKYLLIKDIDLLNSEIREVKNRFIPNGELFFKVVLDNIYFNDISPIVNGDAKCRSCGTSQARRWHNNNTTCNNCYEKSRNQKNKPTGNCNSCGSTNSIAWFNDRTLCNKCFQQNNIMAKYSRAKSQAKFKGLQFSIEKEIYFDIINNGCYYCGTSLNDKGTGYNLDRIDNSKGYTEQNVLPCCGECNRIRSDVYTVEEMKILGKVLKTINTMKEHNDSL